MILESERLLFRPNEPGDLEAYCALQADPELRRYIGGAPRSREVAEQKFRNGLKKAGKTLSLRATIYKPEGVYIGECGLYPNFRPGGSVPGEAMLSFVLARQYWGRGLATEAGRLFVAYGFEKLRLRRIQAVIQTGNAASARVLEKLGFRWTRHEEGARCFDHFELLRPVPRELTS